MNDIDTPFKELSQLPYFTQNQLRQIRTAQPSSVNIFISRSLKTQKIWSLKRGVYQTDEFRKRSQVDTDFLPAMSSVIRPHSYLSTTYVLQRAGILTEVTYPITAITSMASRTYTNELGTFVYQHIKPALYTGYQLYQYQGIVFAMASPAKALFDWLYLRPFDRALQLKTFNYAGEFRLNIQDWRIKDIAEFTQYVTESKSPKLDRILKNFQRHVWQVSQ